MSKWPRALVLFAACLFITGAGFAQSQGAISGFIMDEVNTPVVGAKVSADPINGQGLGSLVRSVETDAAGRFVLGKLAWGEYKVFAMKEEADYPDMRWSFYSDDTCPIVKITSAIQTTEVRIRLGPKAGILAGSVTDALTGAPVNVGFKLTRAAAPQKWISTAVAPRYRVLLPSSTDVLLEVSAPGFKTWKFPSPLNLQPGEEMHLDIALEPAHDPSLRPSKFLIPDGYTGWVRLEHDFKDAQPVPVEDGAKIFKFPESGILYTSSAGPERGADDEYVYYSHDGSRHPIVLDYRGGKGTIWGQYQGSRGGVMSLFGFFVGTEEQYKKYQSQSGHPGPIPAEQPQNHR
jgi:hypothetical protein